MAPWLIKPPLTVTSGLAMKNFGRQKTRSASFPGVMEPTYLSTPNVIAGLIVTFAR